MNRPRACLLLLLLLLLILAGCRSPIDPPDPYPYSFTDPSKKLYPCTIAGARRFISDSRPPRWEGAHNSYVKAPDDSAATLHGDCDDFAVMMAHYLQEYWGYDTFIVLLDNITPREPSHAVAFVNAPSGLIDPGLDCDYPYLSVKGVRYDPVDWTACPGWMWVEYGGTMDYEPSRWFKNWLTGKWCRFSAGQMIEWYEMVNLLLHHSPMEPALDSTDHLPQGPASIPHKCLTSGTTSLGNRSRSGSRRTEKSCCMGHLGT